MKKSLWLVSSLMLLLACGDKKGQAESADAAAADSTEVNTVVADSSEEAEKEEITVIIRNIYAAASRNTADLDWQFACHSWRDSVAAVNEKDAYNAEIGFFNDDYWTMMQDDNPDDLGTRDIQFEQLDVKKGRALVSFILQSHVQTVRMKLAFCREDGDWRVHDIVRFYTDENGNETSFSFMESMQKYLNEPEASPSSPAESYLDD